MQWLSTMDRSLRHLQLEVVQPGSSFPCICIMKPNLISLGVQRLCIMGDTINPGLGGWEENRSRPGAGSLRTLGGSFPFALFTILFFSIRSQWS